jgi:cytidylate kinase
MEIKMSYAIAIDGPAGAGKSTIAKLVAKELGYVYVDTGAMFRAMGIYFMDNGVDADDENGINSAVDKVDVSITYVAGEQQVLLNGDNVTGRLREEAVGKAASRISRYASVRKKLLELQRELALSTNVVMDGRDIGTTVLPNAQTKLYLTASVEARAKRRYDELVAKGETADLASIKADIENRDYQDMHREISPLRQAEDAVLLDTSDMDIPQVVDAVRKLVK